MSEPEKRKSTARLTPVVYVERGADAKPVKLTPDGLALVTNLATYRKPQSYIASTLGITKHQFTVLLGKPDDATELRLAWERGNALHEDEYRKILFEHAKKNPIPAIFYGKSVFEMKDNAPAPPSVEHRIQIVLPASQTRAEYFATLGIEAPLDFRSARAKAEHAEIEQENRMMLALPSPGQVIDVTPVASESDEPPRIVSRRMSCYLRGQGTWREGVDVIDEELE